MGRVRRPSGWSRCRESSTSGSDDQVWDDLGYAAAETGMVFCTLVLVTGIDLGQADLGHVVDLGFAADDDF